MASIQRNPVTETDLDAADVEIKFPEMEPQNGGDAELLSSEGDRAAAAESTAHNKSKPPPVEIRAAKQLDPLTTSSSDPKTPTSARPEAGADKLKTKERKIGHRRVDDEGQITFKKIETSQIMGSIQLGIAYAVGSLASLPQHDLLLQDFEIVETTSFPRDGSSITPAHRYSSFKFKTYAPVAFRRFRDLFGIKPDDFLLSLCHHPMRELTNPGASGSIFYLSDDDEFIIKTVQRKEAEFLQRLLPGYYMNLNQNPRTLLPKFFGLYCYQCGGKNVRLIVMNNLLPSSVSLNEKYDLKGSTYKRKANRHERAKNSPTYKDLDFMERHSEGILLEVDTYNALMKTIQRDCRVLESFKIMDYSLLVGVHNADFVKREKWKQEHVPTAVNDHQFGDGKSPGYDVAAATPLARSKSFIRQRLAAYTTAMESIQVEGADQEEDVPAGGIPAKSLNGDRLLLFIGIIDILQSFHLKKKIEHTWKSMIHDGDTVSVHRPGFYAQRFQDFMKKTVFRKVPLPIKRSPSKKKAPQRSLTIAESSQAALRQRIASDTEDRAPTKVSRSISVLVPSSADSFSDGDDNKAISFKALSASEEADVKPDAYAEGEMPQLAAKISTVVKQSTEDAKSD